MIDDSVTFHRRTHYYCKCRASLAHKGMHHAPQQRMMGNAVKAWGCLDFWRWSTLAERVRCGAYVADALFRYYGFVE